ncbi:MAG: hypothetical protein QXD90_00680, partial [Candidatus Nitrosocaldus sp.]
MNWKNTTPLFLFLLMIIGGGIVGTIFVLAQQQLTGSLPDTASFTDSILSALTASSIASLLPDTASFTDSILSALTASSIASLLPDT